MTISSLSKVYGYPVPRNDNFSGLAYIYRLKSLIFGVGWNGWRPLPFTAYCCQQCYATAALTKYFKNWEDIMDNWHLTTITNSSYPNNFLWILSCLLTFLRKNVHRLLFNWCQQQHGLLWRTVWNETIIGIFCQLCFSGNTCCDPAPLFHHLVWVSWIGFEENYCQPNGHSHLLVNTKKLFWILTLLKGSVSVGDTFKWRHAY